MSFDLYFLALRPGQSWEGAMAELEATAAEDPQPLSVDGLATWSRIKDAVAPVLPSADEFVGELNRELSDDATGIQLALYGAELSLTVPYWYGSTEAERIVAVLREVVAGVEEATGLTAYDPQADAPFLGEGDRSAAGTMDSVRRSFEERGIDSPPGSQIGQQQLDRPRSVWARLFRPGRG